MFKIPKQEYATEFMELAVKRVQSGEGIVKVAQELGLVEQTLRNWVKATKAGKFSLPGAKAVTPEQMFQAWEFARGSEPTFAALVEGWSSTELVALANYLIDTKRPAAIASLRTTLQRVNKSRGQSWTIKRAKGAARYTIGATAKPRGRNAIGTVTVRTVPTLNRENILEIVGKFGARLNPTDRKEFADACYVAAKGLGS